jgi:tRNA (guanine-N7-)-methyltransferase
MQKDEHGTQHAGDGGRETKSTFSPSDLPRADTARPPEEHARSPEVIVGETDTLVWRDIFGNDAPVEVDIGCGKGRFLMESAAARPRNNFLGIEKAGRPFRLCRERVAKRCLPNVRILRADAHEVVRHQIWPQSVSAYYVLFPDPWPKKRHHKRRIFTASFVDALARTLQPGGTLDIATDIADYFDEIALLVEPSGRFRVIAEGPYPAEFSTNFAAKYQRQGREMYYARYVVQPTAPHDEANSV